jgi:hypothetical protein
MEAIGRLSRSRKRRLEDRRSKTPPVIRRMKWTEVQSWTGVEPWTVLWLSASCLIELKDVSKFCGRRQLKRLTTPPDCGVLHLDQHPQGGLLQDLLQKPTCRFCLLGTISHLEQDGDKLELGRGLLQECSKLDMLEMIVRNR